MTPDIGDLAQLVHVHCPKQQGLTEALGTVRKVTEITLTAALCGGCLHPVLGDFARWGDDRVPLAWLQKVEPLPPEEAQRVEELFRANPTHNKETTT